MPELITGYVLIGVAILIPVAILAGIVYVLFRPLSIDEVNRRHRERGDAADPASGGNAGDARPERRGRPRRTA